MKIHIPCSEVLRHFLCPTRRFAQAIINGKFDIFTNSKEPAHSAKKLTAGEVDVTNFLRASPEGVRAARYPYKMLKIIRITNSINRQQSPLPLCALLPTMKEIRLRMSVYCTDNDDTIVVQIHRTTRIADVPLKVFRPVNINTFTV
nr:hypothetical protein [uncultured Pseudomonas sp.]